MEIPKPKTMVFVPSDTATGFRRPARYAAGGYYIYCTNLEKDIRAVLCACLERREHDPRTNRRLIIYIVDLEQTRSASSSSVSCSENTVLSFQVPDIGRGRCVHKSGKYPEFFHVSSVS